MIKEPLTDADIKAIESSVEGACDLLYAASLGSAEREAVTRLVTAFVRMRGAHEKIGAMTREEYAGLVVATGLSAEEVAGMRALEAEDNAERMAQWCDERAAQWDKVPGRSWLADTWRKQAAAWRESFGTLSPAREVER